MSVWLPGVENRRNASRTPAEANMNVFEDGGVLFMEVPTPVRVDQGNPPLSDITVLVVAICATSHVALAVAEVDLPCDGDHGFMWTVLRKTSTPSPEKLKRWKKSVQKLLNGVFRDDRGRGD